MSIRKRQPRRGILLLIVLSLLVLFVLVGMTFIIVTNQSYRAAKDIGHVERVGDPPIKLLDEAMYQLLRGSNNRASVNYDGGLLGDKYGNDFDNAAHDGVLAVNTVDTNGQFLLLQANPPSPLLWRTELDFYAGCELTMLDGPAKGITTKIVRSSVSLNNPQRLDFYIERFVSENGAFVPIPQTGNRFHINGHPFNGTGAGYDPINRVMSLDALHPNFGKVTTNPIPFVGGVDEGWDLPDFQNVFLARVPAIPERDTHLDLIPSFHRPALLNYWAAHADLTIPQFLRTILHRPNWYDHPNFSGSNPALDPTLFAKQPLPSNPGDPTNALLIDRLIRGLADIDGDGTYESFAFDVDNDSDGIPDSVWVDIGLPPQRRPDGTLYRPLVAIKCIDLDGRANLNCLDNLELLKYGATTFAHINIVGGNSGQRPTGSGYGPPDIQLSIRPNSPNSYLVDNVNERTNLLQRRYGVEPLPVPGTLGMEVMAPFDLLGVPSTYGQVASNFSQPPDFFGQQIVAIDHSGQPVRMSMNTSAMDSPYEINLTQPHGMDTPYTIADMESLLRSGDSDANRLPSRLRSLAPNTFAATQAALSNGIPVQFANRELFTTASIDVPVPNGPVPPHLRNLNDPVTGGPLVSPTLEQLMRARLVAGGSTTIDQDLQYLLAPELRRGEKLDLNRILGNGSDDNGQGTVDVAEGPESMWGVSSPAYTGFDTTVGSSQELFARHLYALAMLIAEHNPTVANGYYNMPTKSGNLNGIDFARRMAQWCVNVVDYRDADACMTRFVYDINPFNGWDISPNSPERDVVYGCEAPELLITESLAFHDRRVADTDRDDGDQSKRLSPLGGEGDKDLDQEAVPQGSLYFELFCPRGRPTNNPMNQPSMTIPPVPLELYGLCPFPDPVPDTNVAKVGVDLARMSPARSDGRQLPVWRLAISESQISKKTGSLVVSPNTPEGNLQGLNRDAYDPNRAPYNLPHDRYVWFTPSVPISEPDRDKIFYNDPKGYQGLQPGQIPVPILAPGGYAVVAPRITTHIGLKVSDREPARQEIRLDPTNTLVEARVTATPPNNPMKPGIIQFGCNGSQVGTGFVRRNPLVVIATADPPATWALPPTSNYRIGMNVSEPMPRQNYYQKPPTTYLSPGNLEGYYGAPYSPFESIPDEPLDFKSTTPLGKDNLLKTGTYPNYRTAFLQRLANPLLAWNPEPSAPEHIPALPVNPYVTVDWMPIDLTVFNGHDTIPTDSDPNDNTDTSWDYSMYGAFDSDPSMPGNPGDPQADELAVDLEGKVHNGIPGQHVFEFFASRERGFDLTKNQLTATEFPNVFAPESQPRKSDVVATQDHFVNRDLSHSLGHLNTDRYGGVSVTGVTNYEGAPRKPFPWLTWNNRPYASEVELLTVPASSPGRLLLEFNEDDEYMGNVGQLLDPTPANDTPFPVGTTRKDFFRPYRHLWNFFHASTTANPASPNLFRLLDYVHVPSRFAGTNRWYNPTSIEFDPVNINASVPANDPRRLFATPFNRLSRMRDPGKINLNTITQPVFEAMFPPATWGNMGTNWSDFSNNRRGYIADAQNPKVGEHFLHREFPSEFANPYRAASGADLYFPPSIQTYITSNNLGITPLVGNEATLLRRKGLGAARPNDLLFASHVQTPLPLETSLYDASFRYDALKRLGNITTTHSNVYAVWITVGYFALEAATNPDPIAHPDGYQLGREIGIETGEVQRHRAFYMIDRSIPVAYEKGADHNVDKCIMLRRILEN